MLKRIRGVSDKEIEAKFKDLLAASEASQLLAILGPRKAQKMRVSLS